MIHFTSGDMFDAWDSASCPIIPTNLTKWANAGIAAEIRNHTPVDEFAQMHASNPQGGLLQFSNGLKAWDLPTKLSLEAGSKSYIPLMIRGMRDLWIDGPILSKYYGIKIILLPMIGTGFGGLKWAYVWDHIGPYARMMAQNIDVWVYDEGAPR